MAGWLPLVAFRMAVPIEEAPTTAPEPQTMDACYDMETTVGLPHAEERGEPCSRPKKGSNAIPKTTRVAFT